MTEYFKFYECTQKIHKNFVILRNFDVFNDNIEDKDLYFIDKESLEDIKNESKKYSTAFPIPNTGSLGFSANYKDFVNNQFGFSFEEDVYELYDSNLKPVDIPCDIVKIYHPHTVKGFNGIIYFDTYINSIHVHFYCKRYELQKTYSKEEIRVDNNIYSEYIQVELPSIESLLSGDIYFKEDLYKASFESENNNDVIIKETENGNGNYVNYIRFSCFTLPYKIVETDGVTKKMYVSTADIDRKRNSISYPINVTMYPSTKLDDNGNTWLLDEDKYPSANVYMCNTHITLSSKLSFNDGKIALISKFIYPEIPGVKFNNVNDAYIYLNSLSKKQQIEYSSFELDAEDLEAMADKLDGHYIGEPIRCTGYIVDIATDTDFKNIIYSSNQQLNPIYYDETGREIDMSGISEDEAFRMVKSCTIIEDFAQELNNIFSSWDQHPDILTIRATYIDNYLGIVIYGNYVALTKEYFKYLINDTNIYRAMINADNLKEKINFIDTFKCIINKKSDDNKINAVGANVPKIIYKPVFYRVGNLQNLSIRANVTQNIGVNLVDFMTKVETFKLNIDGTQYVEYARNDIFVIFKVNAQNIVNTAGTYDITNQDDEYISSGSWSIV